MIFFFKKQNSKLMVGSDEAAVVFFKLGPELFGEEAPDASVTRVPRRQRIVQLICMSVKQILITQLIPITQCSYTLYNKPIK